VVVSLALHARGRGFNPHTVQRVKEMQFGFIRFCQSQCCHLNTPWRLSWPLEDLVSKSFMQFVCPFLAFVASEVLANSVGVDRPSQTISQDNYQQVDAPLCDLLLCRVMLSGNHSASLILCLSLWVCCVPSSQTVAPTYVTSRS
jgi:hypothetical protein